MSRKSNSSLDWLRIVINCLSKILGLGSSMKESRSRTKKTAPNMQRKKPRNKNSWKKSAINSRKQNESKPKQKDSKWTQNESKMMKENQNRPTAKQMFGNSWKPFSKASLPQACKGYPLQVSRSTIVKPSPCCGLLWTVFLYTPSSKVISQTKANEHT